MLQNEAAKPYFRWYMKQSGAMMAKGGLLSMQFLELLQNHLHFDLARHANSAAERLSAGIEAKGYRFMSKPQSNLIFPIPKTIPLKRIMPLTTHIPVYVW